MDLFPGIAGAQALPGVSKELLVDLAVVRHFFFRLRQRKIGLNLAMPLAAFAVCFCLWVNLSGFALRLGAGWLILGIVYLLILTRGFRRNLVSLRFE
jgi:putrescine importer